MGLSCWEQLGAILAWEWRDPALSAVHFLTVASYNLQHPAQFTDEALEGLRAAFIDYLDHDVPADILRKRVAHSLEGEKKVLKDKAEQKVSYRSWRITIADVYVPDRPEGAAGRVRQWARYIRSEI
jgi:hypothetical protein